MMKKEVEKKLFKVVKKVVDLEIYGDKYRGEPPYYSAIFHQPTDPVRIETRRCYNEQFFIVY